MLLERDHLLEHLGEALDDAVGGRGRMVLVSGEAGAGKSSLVRRFVADVREREPRPDTLIGHCDPLTTPRPLGPLLDVARRPESGLGSLLQDRPEPYAIFDRVLERLCEAATVLVIEDAHWADAATVDMLRYLGRRVVLTSAVIVVTYRDDEVGTTHSLARLLGELATGGDAVSRLGIPPLTVDAVRELTAGSGGLRADEVHRITGATPSSSPSCWRRVRRCRRRCATPSWPGWRSSTPRSGRSPTRWPSRRATSRPATPSSWQAWAATSSDGSARRRCS